MKKTGIIIFLVSVICAGYAQTTEKKVIQSPDAPKAIGPYSQAILAGNTLYVSGQIGIDPLTGKLDTLNFEVEIKRVLSNLELVLKEAGMGFENIVKATIYTTDLKNFRTINEIYGAKFKEKPPARETVQVAALPAGAHVEISCIAVK